MNIDYNLTILKIVSSLYPKIIFRKLGMMRNGDEYYLAENNAYPPIKNTGEERILGRVATGIRMLLFR